jgi:hypothetical protein
MMIVSVFGRRGGMFKQITKMVWPYKKTLSWVLIGVGALLLVVFVPIEIWMALAGVILIIIGVVLVKG